EEKHVTYLPAYGAEMRGGTANCTVTVSDKTIASPVGSYSNIGIFMNTPSFLKFQKQITKNGIVLLNSDLIESRPSKRNSTSFYCLWQSRRAEVRFIDIPANTIAQKIGDIRIANIVMCGGLARATGLVSLDSLINGVKTIFKNKGSLVCDTNTQALIQGALCIEEKGVCDETIRSNYFLDPHADDVGLGGLGLLHRKAVC
ncbi:MAG: 2-oxoacid:acceptor oxidoreductase family protein, partial [Pseudomonadota bacterium]